MHICREQEGSWLTRMVTVSALVNGGYIIGVEQVIDVQLEIEIAIHAITQFRVGDPVTFGVGWRTHGPVGTAMHTAHVASARANRDIIGSLILVPQRERMFWRIRQG